MHILFIQKTVKLVRAIECFHATMVLYKYLKSLKHDDHILHMKNSITGFHCPASNYNFGIFKLFL
jgi:hypothetical protein